MSGPHPSGDLIAAIDDLVDFVTARTSRPHQDRVELLRLGEEIAVLCEVTGIGLPLSLFASPSGRGREHVGPCRVPIIGQSDAFALPPSPDWMAAMQGLRRRAEPLQPLYARAWVSRGMTLLEEMLHWHPPAVVAQVRSKEPISLTLGELSHLLTTRGNFVPVKLARCRELPVILSSAARLGLCHPGQFTAHIVTEIVGRLCVERGIDRFAALAMPLAEVAAFLTAQQGGQRAEGAPTDGQEDGAAHRREEEEGDMPTGTGQEGSNRGQPSAPPPQHEEVGRTAEAHPSPAQALSGGEDDALNDKQKIILETMLANEISGRHRRKKIAEVVPLINRNGKRDQYVHAFAALRRAGYIASGPSSRGGVWLTPQGSEAARRLRT
jgi:hypothetical protein